MWYDTRPDPPTRINLTVFSFFPFRFIFFSFSSFSFPEKRSRWRSSRRIRTRRMPCSTSSWVSHSCKGVSSSLFLNASCENRTRFVTVIFLFAGGHQRKGNNHFSFTVERWKLKESKYFSKRIRFIENVKGVLSMSLVQNYWNLIGRVVAANVGEKKKKKRRQKIGRKICWHRSIFFIRNRPWWSDE